MDSESFDGLFNLEDQYFDDGYKQGYADGLRQSRTEAEVFGIEQSFKKFVVMGELHVRAKLWVTAMSPHSVTVPQVDAKMNATTRGTFSNALEHVKTMHKALEGSVPPSQSKVRLQRHVDILIALVDPETLSLENSDDAVLDFNDRLRRAQAKAKVIERLIGEAESETRGTRTATSRPSAMLVQPNSNIEDFATLRS